MHKIQSLKAPTSVVVLILVILLAVNVLAFTIRLSNALTSGYTYEYSDLMRSAERRDMPELADGIFRNETQSRTPQQDTSDMKNLVDFYDAAFLYYAGEENASSKMEAARSAIGNEKLQNIANELGGVFESAAK